MRNNILLTIFLISILNSCSQGYDPNAEKKHIEKVKRWTYWKEKFFSSIKTEKLKGMAYIPKGEFIMGNDNIEEKNENKIIFSSYDQSPKHKVYLDDFYIDRFEVTNGQASRVIEHIGKDANLSEYPVVEINWQDANTYCDSLGKRLPTENEWEKAARGPKGNIYTWGDIFNENNANIKNRGFGGILPVGTISTDKSFYGIYDMVGNVSEWTKSFYKAYPESKYKNEDFGEKYRVVKGYSWDKNVYEKFLEFYTMSSFRQTANEAVTLTNLGFRCAVSSSLKSVNIAKDMVNINYSHYDNIDSDYSIDKYEVTSKDFNLYNPQRDRNHQDKMPVSNIDWFSAERYCRWLGKRLPTESEWENAKKGKENFSYVWGNEAKNKLFLNSLNILKDEGTYKVGTLPFDKTGLGVFDMAGNVFEWVMNDEFSKKKIDDIYMVKNNKMVVKGGGPFYSTFTYEDIKERYKIYIRNLYDGDFSSDNIGFRCAF